MSTLGQMQSTYPVKIANQVLRCLLFVISAGMSMTTVSSSVGAGEFLDNVPGDWLLPGYTLIHADARKDINCTYLEAVIGTLSNPNLLKVHAIAEARRYLNRKPNPSPPPATTGPVMGTLGEIVLAGTTEIIATYRVTMKYGDPEWVAEYDLLPALIKQNGGFTPLGFSTLAGKKPPKNEAYFIAINGATFKYECEVQ